MDVLKLQGADHAREARHYAHHLPWPQAVARCPRRAALGFTVVLVQASRGMGRGSDVERGMADGASEDVDHVEGWYWFGLHSHFWTCRYIFGRSLCETSCRVVSHQVKSNARRMRRC